MANLSLEVVKKEFLATRPTLEDMNLNKLDLNKEVEFAIQAFKANPYLLSCDPETVKNVLKNVVVSGITLNPVMKYGYLVPRKGKCCLDVSYMGMIKIVTDTGSVKSIKAGIYYKNESFDIELGSGGYVKHKPYFGEGSKGKRIGAYSVAELNDGSYHVEFMYEAELMAFKARSEGVKAGKGSPWLTDEDEMCRKTVVKRHWKYLPKSERAMMAASAIDLENETNGIDFKAEQNQKQQGQPVMEEGVALCTFEDIDRIMELLTDPAMPEVILVSESRPQGYKKSAMVSAIQKQYDAGTYEKHRAESLIASLESEIKKANAPDVDLSDDATDTDAKEEAKPAEEPAEEVEIKTSAIQPNESFEDFK